MTQIFDDTGTLVAVTAIEVGPCHVVKVLDKKVQLGFDAAKKNIKKPIEGIFKKVNITPCAFIREVTKEADKEYKVGDQIKADVFKAGDRVDISGISIGKGFQGGMKRWKWSGTPMTHGMTSHRRVGSIGSSTSPGRVWKGHHMPGHMGNIAVTAQGLKVVKVDAEKNYVLVNGAVPGKKNHYVIVKKAVKGKK